jgi:serine/threonine protein kinase
MSVTVSATERRICRTIPYKVLDFGLVKHTVSGQRVTMLSTEGHLVGTPGYMAPEIALARADVDGRADVYAVGCVAYYMLTGQPAFSGDTPVVTALARAQRAHSATVAFASYYSFGARCPHHGVSGEGSRREALIDGASERASRSNDPGTCMDPRCRP